MLVQVKHKTAKDANGQPLTTTFEKTVWQTKIMQGGEWNFVKYVEEPSNFKSVSSEIKAQPIKPTVTTKSCCGRK